MKKVCIFVWNNLNNDARVIRESTALVEEGFDVKVICLDNNKKNNLKVINGVKIKRVKSFPQIYMKLKTKKNEAIRLLELLFIPIIIIKMTINGKKTKSDIYHCNDINTLIQGYICSKITFNKKKLIYDSHELQVKSTNFYKGKKVYKLEKFLIKKVDEIIMTTNTRADEFSKIYNTKKPIVLHNYPALIEPDEVQAIDIHNKLNIDKEELILLYQGGLQRGRGLENIIKASKDFITGKVVLLGDGPLKQKLKELVKEYKLEKKVYFINAVPYGELFYYTKNAYLGFQVLENTCFNHYSTLSNKLFEYIMMEVPVIASDFPEINKIVKGNKIGLLIDPHDSDSIVKAVNIIIENKNMWRKLKLNCKLAREKYNWQKEKYKLYETYSSISGGDNVETTIG